MAEQSGESANDASDTDNTSRAQRKPANSESCFAEIDEEVDQTSEANARETRGGGEEQQAGAAGKGCGGSAGAGVVQVVQDRMGGDRGADSERTRYALCVPVLPEIAPRPGSGARL